MATAAQLIALIEADLPDNGIGSITPSVMRTVLEAIVAYAASTVGAGTPFTAVLLAVEALQPGGVAVLQQALPPDPSNPINICWNHAINVVQPDPLRLTTTGYLWRFIGQVTGLDMNTVIINANQITGY